MTHNLNHFKETHKSLRNDLTPAADTLWMCLQKRPVERKILIIQTAFIGDVVLATPLIEKLSERYPTAQIDFLLRKGNESLLLEHPKLRKVLIWDKQHNKLKNFFKLIKKIRKEPYDLLINLQRFGSTGLMSWFSTAREKIGFKKNPFSFSYDKKVEHQIKEGVHEVDRNLRLIGHLTGHTSTKPRLYPPAMAYEKVKQYQDQAYLVLAPTSVWFTKQFPEKKWIEFLGQLIYDGNIFLIGARADKEACERIIKKSGKGTNLCGKLSLIESVALIEKAQMNYVNDSAPMHFASAVNAPTCAVFCSTISDFGFGPLSDQSFIVEINKPLDCRPCGLHGKKVCPQGHFKCGRDIDVHPMTELVKP